MMEKKMMGEKVEEGGEREGEDDVIGKDEMVRKEEKGVVEMDEMMKEVVENGVLENGKADRLMMMRRRRRRCG